MIRHERRFRVKASWLLNYGLCISIGVMIMITSSANAYGINGPLRVHPTNPRYFTDDSGHVIYLTGSHMWNIPQGDHVGIAPCCCKELASPW